MPIGSGKYDDACTIARAITGGSGTILIVLGGKHGSGFSAQLPTMADNLKLPGILRQIADEIEATLKASQI